MSRTIAGIRTIDARRSTYCRALASTAATSRSYAPDCLYCVIRSLRSPRLTGVAAGAGFPVDCRYRYGDTARQRPSAARSTLPRRFRCLIIATILFAGGLNVFFNDCSRNPGFLREFQDCFGGGFKVLAIFSRDPGSQETEMGVQSLFRGSIPEEERCISSQDRRILRSKHQGLQVGAPGGRDLTENFIARG